eukprot:Trichotokara_eunicae@DN794_c0_g1_i1.p1
MSTSGSFPPDDMTLNERQLCDLEMMLLGAFSPLKGYMNQAEYDGTVNDMRLPNGHVWTIPIVLPLEKSRLVSKKENMASSKGVRYGVVKLRDAVGTVIAELHVDDVYEFDLEKEIVNVLGSSDNNHPYAKYLRTAHGGCVYLGGEVKKVHSVARFD